MATTPPPPGGMPPGRPPGSPPGSPAGVPPGSPAGVPPGTPPYGGVPYGMNPRDYWRYQKDQNRAAWRAQRDAWRAQRDVLRAQSRANRTPSIVGPVLLIGVGVIALLLITGRLNSDMFWNFVEHWWPLLLIGLGILALGEWAIDLRRENPPARRYGGYVWLVILIIFLGLSGSGWHHGANWFRSHVDDNDDMSGFLGDRHELDQPAVMSAIPADAAVEIQNPRGDISITAGDSPEITVHAQQVAFVGSDSEANKIFEARKPHVTVSGNAVLVKVDGNSNGRTNLSITVPRTVSVNLKAQKGGVTVAGLNGNVDVESNQGDLQTTDIHGNVHVRLSGHKDFAAHDITGDVTIEGTGGSLTLSDIHGKVTMEGDYVGDTHLERVDQVVHFHSSRTDLEFARLPGNMTLDGDSLHASQVVGPVRVICNRSKDVEMTEIYGDTRVQDKDALVELGMAGSYEVDVKNQKGDIEVSLPKSVAATVDARTHNGDINSDFPLLISGDDNKTATGNIGKGGPRVTLVTDQKDIRIRKGEDFGAVPAVPKTPATPPVGGKAPSAPKAPVAPKLGKEPHLTPKTGDSPKVENQ